MSFTAILCVLASYFIGAVPFGYLVARMRCVDIFRAGSGNIGATNIGRVLGRKYGILVFALDFFKGAVPTAITGFYGQNVPYPGYGLHWGFVASAASIAVICVVLYLMFKRRDWL